MKKKLIISVVALILSILIGINVDLIKPSIETIYCKVLPEECK